MAELLQALYLTNQILKRMYTGAEALKTGVYF
jgi:hypothetical protein